MDPIKTTKYFCTANGCPMFGSMTSSTTGGPGHGGADGEYYCFLHFGCKPGTSHAITNELQRLSWLVKLTQAVRAKGGSKEWDALETAANREIRLNQSSHLIRGDHESLPKWLARLEDTLRAACAEPEVTQQPLDV